MPNQVLNISPENELKFKVDASGHFEQGFTTYMVLTNPTNDTVLFKIKTTAPKKYCVRPNSGALEPYSKVDIAITPQPVYVEPNEKHKHKFMVQSVIAPEGKTNIDQVWKEINITELMDHKLKCVFEPARGTNDAGDNVAQNDATKKRVVVYDETKATAKGVEVERKKFVEGFASNEENKKNDSDDHAPSATVNAKTAQPKFENADSDLMKATFEVIQLREEESKLRHENLQLKEELLRLRQGSAGEWPDLRHSYGPEKTAQVSLMPWVATAIGMALLGIIIGKFLM